ncbi:MAG: hypothetical protein JW863_21230 [Chitinispirillaceae bacterium]|nr:hypothetical protein [Chitinispirillaceae bacterium]
MQSSFTRIRIALLFCALCASSLIAQSIVADPTEKPYLVLTPRTPKAKVDTVIMYIMVGTASNSCMAPTFSDCRFTIEQSPLAVYPPYFTVKVSFTQDPPPKDRVCTAIYDPVDYGPRFLLGPLGAGTYQVIDAAEDTGDGAVASRVYGEFIIPDETIVDPVACTIKGTVVDDPYPLERMSMPIPDAVVYLIPADMTLDTAAGSIDRIIASGARDSAVTDRSGLYSFSKVPFGSYLLACRHPDYRTVSVMAVVRRDTTINFVLIPIKASASITGTVSLISTDVARPEPVAGCTVFVSRDAIVDTRIIAGPMLRAITDKEGKYTITDIPVTANGEVWMVRAVSGEFSETKKTILSNGTTASIDFSFSEAYANSASVVFKGATFTVASEKYVYQEDEPLKIRYSITNPTRTDMTFGPFSRGCEYDLIVSNGNDKVVYRASAQPVCLDVESAITVEAGQTVSHDFPALYISDLMAAILEDRMVAPRSISIRVSARLQGMEYDSTITTVPVTFEFSYPVATTTAAPKVPKGSTVAYNAARNLLSFTIDKPQNVAVKVYSLDGAMVPLTVHRQFPAGMHQLSLQNVLRNGARGRGVYVIGVKGNGFEKRFSTVNLIR